MGIYMNTKKAHALAVYKKKELNLSQSVDEIVDHIYLSSDGNYCIDLHTLTGRKDSRYLGTSYYILDEKECFKQLEHEVKSGLHRMNHALLLTYIPADHPVLDKMIVKSFMGMRKKGFAESANAELLEAVGNKIDGILDAALSDWKFWICPLSTASAMEIDGERFYFFSSLKSREFYLSLQNGEAV